MKALTASAAVLLASLQVLACMKVEDIRYETEARVQDMARLKGQKVALLALHVNNGRLGNNNYYEPSQTVMDAHRRALLAQLGNHFQMLDATGAVRMVNPETHIKSAGDVAAAISQTAANGGLVVISAYGFARDATRIRILDYEFASDSYLFDSQGTVVWHFYGKSTALAKPPPLSVTEMLERMASNESPSEQGFMDLVGHYSAYVSWLIGTDMQGTKEKNYFVAYPEQQREIRSTVLQNPGIYPALDLRFGPYVRADQQ